MSDAVTQAAKKERPRIANIHVFDLMNYRLPLAGLVSILHRISGMAMFLLLPFVLYLLQLSLTSETTFAYFKGVVTQPLAKLVILGLLWAYFHHFSAGVRHLFMDMHYGLDKDSARQSATGVLVVSLALTALVAAKLFGAF